MALALGSRRSTIAAVASALAAMALAAAVAGRSCGVSQPGPEAAVRDMLHAAKSGDRDTVFELLSPATRSRLEVEAKRATDYVGAAVRFSAKDLLSIGNSEGIAAPKAITLVDESGDRARVLVVSADGDRSYIDLVRLDGLWRIDIPAYGPID
jgi:cysteine synthase